MTLETSDRLLFESIESSILRPTFKLSASLLDIIEKSKEISQKKMWTFQVWFSNFEMHFQCFHWQTKLCFVKIRCLQRHPMADFSFYKIFRKCPKFYGNRVCIFTVKWVLLYIDITWKAAQQGRSHYSKTTIKKPDYSLQLHMGSHL